MDDQAPLIKLVNVYKRYPTPGDMPCLEVLSGISLDIAAGQSLAVVGPSGSGKSTLLNIMGGLDRVSSGSVFLGGRDLAALEESELSTVRNREIGFVFQMHYLLPQLTLIENVLVPTIARSSRDSCDDHTERAERLLERVGLIDRAHYRPGRLSGGECQRAAVVRALINEPGLLLADEPTGSLDEASAANLTDLLCTLNNEEGVALVVVTHSLELAGHMESISILQAGRLKPSSGQMGPRDVGEAGAGQLR